MKITLKILTLAALFTVGHGAIVFAADQGRSMTLGGLTFTDHGSKDVKSQSAIELESDNYYFEPTFLRGAPGQKLKLEIKNTSSTLHNFSISEQNIDVNIPKNDKV